MAASSPLRQLMEGAASQPPIVAASPVSPAPVSEPALLNYRRVTRPGRCASASERGSGSVVHAVFTERDLTDSRVKAACGVQPGARVGWTDWAKFKQQPDVTCARCLSLVKRREQTAVPRSDVTPDSLPAYLRSDSPDAGTNLGLSL